MPMAIAPSVVALAGAGSLHHASFAALAADVTMLGALGVLAKGRPAQVILAALVAAVVLVQAGAVYSYRTPLDRQMAEALLASWGDVRPVLRRALPIAIVAFFLLSTLFAVLLGAVPRALRERRSLRVSCILFAAVAFLGVAAAGPARGAADARLACALPVLVARRGARPFATASKFTGSGGARDGGPTSTGAEAQAQATVNLPVAPTTAPRPPHILFVLGESLRADDYAALVASGHVRFPGEFPDRITLGDHRTPSSYTAIAVWSALTGATPFGKDSEALGRVATVFDVAKAVRDRDGGPLAVTYASAQRRDVLERPNTLAGVTTFSVDDLVGHAVDDEDDVIDLGVDQRLAEKVVSLMDTPGTQTTFTVIHLSGTHAPYYVDPSQVPFQPWSHTVSWNGLPALRNAYRNAIVAQDTALLRMLAAFRRRVGNDPWVAFFTADHGEAFGEHSAIHHGQNLRREQGQVPAFIASGNGALSPAMLAALTGYAAQRTTHFDWLPTIAALLGVGGTLPLASVEPGFAGRSLVDRPRPLGALAIGNCSVSFKCPLDNWGAMDEDHIAYALPWDGDYACLAQGRRDSEGGAEEIPAADSASCTHLRTLANGVFGHQPGKK
jgi:glucan phosphoethanolaminetransferase (alkaline phosphatase superfamily)